jgi:hypothetical protein
MAMTGMQTLQQIWILVRHEQSAYLSFRPFNLFEFLERNYGGISIGTLRAVRIF